MMAHYVLAVSSVWIMSTEREINRSLPSRLRLLGDLPPLPPYDLVWYINTWNPLCDWWPRAINTCWWLGTSVMGWLRAVTIGVDQHMPQIRWHHCHPSQYMIACHIGTYALWHYFAVSYVWTKGLIPSETSAIFSLGQDAILVRFCNTKNLHEVTEVFFSSS